MNLELSYSPNPDFPNRYISPEKLFFFLQNNLSNFISQIGSSTNGKPIYKATFGNGNLRIVAWSQMHGNESNATHAMLDLWQSFQSNLELKDYLFSQMTLDFVFMLNPDGSEKWTRRNALDLDLNRDFLKLSSKEFPILKKLVETGNYQYALNLHEQRTLYSTDGIHPATLSFLAPAEDVERTITETRKKEMAVIVKVADKLKEFLPNRFARYSDEFYPTSTGDNFTKMGIPTILYEGGHFEEDYLRKTPRKFYTIALWEGLRAMIELQGSTEDWEKYMLIPQNKEDHYDIIYRNVKLNTDFPCVLDIAVQYKEEILENYEEIIFVPIVTEVGDCSNKIGWREVDCTGKTFVSKDKYPKMDEKVNFEIL